MPGRSSMSPSSSSLYETCSIAANGNGTDAVLQCIAASMEAQAAAQAADTTTWLLVFAGALVFFMQAGFAMLCAGCVRKKNVQNTMLKNLLDACGAGIAFFAVGYALAFGEETNPDRIVTFMGTQNFFAMGNVNPAFFFFEYAFSATSVTIVAGTLAERCQMAAYLAYSLFLTGFVYPIVAHALWSNQGYLSAIRSDPLQGIGVIDFAGSGVVHLTGGTTALVATWILGARKGRFHDSRGRVLDQPKVFTGHSIALQLIGTMILWFGWYGFNAGSALLLAAPASTGAVAGLTAANTSLAAASGAISALFTNLYLVKRHTGEYSFDLTMAMNGALSGLVAITAPCGTVELWAAIVIGMVAGWVYLAGSKSLLRIKLDDAVDAIPVHMFNGAWGLISTGLFSSPRQTLQAFGTDQHPGLFYTFTTGIDFTLLSNQLLAVIFIMVWTLLTMTPFFAWLNYMGYFRSDSLEELVGLDTIYHGGRESDHDEPSKEQQQPTTNNSDNVQLGPSGCSGLLREESHGL